MFKNDYLVAGGSSTGSATSVFSGLSPMAVGTDTAGSIRIPAAWHSLVGFKPSSKISNWSFAFVKNLRLSRHNM